MWITEIQQHNLRMENPYKNIRNKKDDHEIHRRSSNNFSGLRIIIINTRKSEIAKLRPDDKKLEIDSKKSL